MPTKSCLNCSAPFHVKPSDANRSYFCSSLCYRVFGQRPEEIEKRFWACVDRQTCLGEICGCHKGLGHCWPWMGARSKEGYGNFRINYRQYKSHRLACKFSGIPIPDDLLGCHACDNPPCCNYTHIFPGTDMDNRLDSMNKGRWHAPDISRETRDLMSRGSNNGRAKLTESDIPIIRSLKGLKPAIIVADEFKVSPSMIRWIWKGTSWTHVP